MNRATIDVYLGQHSLIPRCCIDFYVREWRADKNIFWDFDRRARIDSLNYRYIPCEDCLANERVIDIHRCIYGASPECDELLEYLNGRKLEVQT